MGTKGTLLFSLTFMSFISNSLLYNANVHLNSGNVNLNANMNKDAGNTLFGSYNTIAFSPIIQKTVLHFPWRENFLTSSSFNFYNDIKIDPNSPLFSIFKTIELYSGQSMTELFKRFYSLFLSWDDIKTEFNLTTQVSPEALKKIFLVLFPEKQIKLEQIFMIDNYNEILKDLIKEVFPFWPSDSLNKIFISSYSSNDLIKQMFLNIFSKYITISNPNALTLKKVLTVIYKQLFNGVPPVLYNVFFETPNLLQTFEKILAFVYSGSSNFFTTLFSTSTINHTIILNQEILNLLHKFTNSLKEEKTLVPRQLLYFFLVYPHLPFYVNKLFAKMPEDTLINKNTLTQLIQYIMDKYMYNIPKSALPVPVQILIQKVNRYNSHDDENNINSEISIIFQNVLDKITRHTFTFTSIPNELLEFLSKQNNALDIIEQLLHSTSMSEHLKDTNPTIIYQLFKLILTTPADEQYKTLQLLQELLDVIKNIEDHQFVISNIPENLFPMLTSQKLIIYIKLIDDMHLIKPQKLNLVVIHKFLNYIVKVKYNTATFEDLSPEIFALIQLQPDKNILVPQLPNIPNSAALSFDLIQFLTDITNRNLNWKNIPSDVINFFLNTQDIDEIFYTILEGPLQLNVDINPNTIVKFLHYVKKYKTNELTSYDLTPDLLQFMLTLKDRTELLPIDFDDEVTPNLIYKFITFVHDTKTKQVNINDIPIDLLYFFENSPKLPEVLTEVVELPFFKHKHIDFKVMLDFIHIVPKIKKGTVNLEGITPDLLGLIFTLPRVYSIYFGSEVNPSILNSLTKLINDIELKQLNTDDTSPYLLQFLTTYPKLKSLVVSLMTTRFVPTHNIPNEEVLQIIMLIKNIQDNNVKLAEIPLDTFKYLAELPYEFKIKEINVRTLLNLIDFMNEVISKGQNVRIIPKNLIHFFKSFPNQEIIIRDLYYAPYILKSMSPDDLIEFITLIKELDLSSSEINIDGESTELEDSKESPSLLYEIPDDIRQEIIIFINNLMHNKYHELSQKVLNFIISYPKLQPIIRLIYKLEHIPENVVSPNMVQQILLILKNNLLHIPMKNIPKALLNFVIHLEGGEKLTHYILNSYDKSHDDMMQLFLQIINTNGGKDIPPNLRQFIMSFSNGQKIIEFLEKPGEIQCERTDNVISCTKIIYVTDKVYNTEDLVQLIKDTISYKIDLNHIPHKLLEFLLTTPHLRQELLKLFTTQIQLPENIDRDMLIKFFELVKLYLNHEPITVVPNNVLKFVLAQEYSCQFVNAILKAKLKELLNN